MSRHGPKVGPARPYTEAEIAHFAEFCQERAYVAPALCNGGAVCWVAAGPPAINGNGECLGCGGTPQAWRTPPRKPKPKYPRHF